MFAFENPQLLTHPSMESGRYLRRSCNDKVSRMIQDESTFGELFFAREWKTLTDTEGLGKSEPLYRAMDRIKYYYEEERDMSVQSVTFLPLSILCSSSFSFFSFFFWECQFEKEKKKK